MGFNENKLSWCLAFGFLSSTDNCLQDQLQLPVYYLTNVIIKCLRLLISHVW